MFAKNIFLHCIESPYLGRFDKNMLSEQDLLELFFTADDADVARERFGGDVEDACT